MYEQSARWNEYYREPDPKRRKALLDSLLMSEPDDGANAFRLRLYEVRHANPRAPRREVDRFLFHCVNFIQLYQSARWFRRGAAREVEAALREMLWDEAPQFGQSGERALYWELRNAVARYFQTCQGAGYHRAAFGLIEGGRAGKLDHMARDAWQMSEGLSARVRLQERLALWNRAVLDAFLCQDGQSLARYKAYSEGTDRRGGAPSRK